MPPKTKVQCGSCDEDIKRGDDNVGCSACKVKYHLQCTSLNENERKVLASKSNLKWFCILCDDDVCDMLNNFEKFRKVSKEIKILKKDMEAKLKAFEERVVKCEVSGRSNDVEVSDQSVIRSFEVDREETELIEAKKCNLIYFNVPESSKEESTDRMKDDFKLLTESYSDTKIVPNDINAIFRVGKKDDNVTRPVVVKFANVETRKRVLTANEDLKLKFNDEIINIFVSVDRTQKQREVHKKLVNELRRRKDAGDTDLVIRNDKIVTNFRKTNGNTKIKWSDLFKN